MQDAAAAGEVTLPDLGVSRSILPSTKQPRQDPTGHASTLRQSRGPEGFDAKDAVKAPSKTPGSSKRANQHPTSESEQRNPGGGTKPQRLTGHEQQPQRPRRSDASVEMVALSPSVLSMNPTTVGTKTEAAAGDADPERSESGSEVTQSAVKSSLISESVINSGSAGSSRPDATEATVERHGESHLLIIAPVSRETESITGAAEDFKAQEKPNLTVATPSLQSRDTEEERIGVPAIERKETQTMFNTVSPKPQTSPQCAGAETEAGEVEVEDVHTHTVLEIQHYHNVTPVFKNSTQPSSDLSSDLMTGDSFFQSKSKSTQQNVVSSSQPPTDTVTRTGAKLRPGVRGQRVRFGFCFNHSINCSLDNGLAIRIRTFVTTMRQYQNYESALTHHICS